ncbi:MAG: helix-turn-helix domain-containing protein [Firmicutes bacterium]|nr:helix-turn-helix domain-containing protein [Bacillota bacterium]
MEAKKMEYTLAKLLNDGILDNWESVTEGIDYESIVVKSISVQELPMAAFLSPGEIVLTIAHGAGEDPDIIRRIVEEAGATGAAAVFFAFDEERKKVTKKVKEYAESIGLPLIRIDFDQKFTEIMDRVNKAIRMLRYEPYRRLQSDLFNAYFEGASLEDAVALTASSLKAPLAIADPYGEILAQTGDYRDGSVNVSIEVNGLRFGELRIGSDEILAHETEILKRYISFPVTLWFNQKRIEKITNAGMVSDFVLRLAKGEMNEALKREAGFLGIDLGKRYRAVIMEPVTAGLDQKMGFVRNTYEMMQRAGEAAEKEGLTAICGAEAERFTVFVESPLGGSSAAVDLFIARWARDIEKMFPALTLHFGVSREFRGDGGFRAGYSEALLSATYCEGDETKTVYYEEARKIRIMAAISSQESIREDAAGLLSGIIEYDKGGGSMELMKTLETLIKANGNVSETARQLCIHRQSLLFRIQKIEDLTGLSLKNHDDLFVLEVYSRLFVNY